MRPLTFLQGSGSGPSSKQNTSPSSTRTTTITVLPPAGPRKGAWSQEEDTLLIRCMEKHGSAKWSRIPQLAGLNRCRKSCRLRWLNYLNPSIKKGSFDEGEEDLIIRLHNLLGNRWSLIAGRLPGRTPNDIKNYWNSHLSKRITRSKKIEPFKPQPRYIPLNWNWLTKQRASEAERQTEDAGMEVGPSDGRDDPQAWVNQMIIDEESDDAICHIDNLTLEGKQIDFAGSTFDDILGCDDLLSDITRWYDNIFV